MNMNIKRGWFWIMVVGLIVLGLLVISMTPRVFDFRWAFWVPENVDAVVTDVPATIEEASAAIADAESEVAEASAAVADADAEAKTEAPIVVDLLLKYSDKEYIYKSQLWEMDFGTVLGIELTGEGFERINEASSTASFVVPEDYSAIIFTDGLGNNKGEAIFDNSEISRFDKGNPTLVGNSVIVPSKTKISIPFAGNDSSGVLVVFSKDTTLLEKYIDLVK